MVVLKKAQWTEETQPKARTPRSTETPSAGWFCHLAIMVCLWLFKAVFLDKTGAPFTPLTDTTRLISPVYPSKPCERRGGKTHPALNLQSKFLLRWPILSWGTALHIQPRGCLSWKQLEARRVLGTSGMGMPSSSPGIHLTLVR